jgi:hypothetical protein
MGSCICMLEKPVDFFLTTKILTDGVRICPIYFYEFIALENIWDQLLSSHWLFQ